MVDKGTTVQSVDDLWQAVGKRIAVAAGAAVALTSLLVDAPLWVASLRGATVTLGVWWVVRLGLRLLVWSLQDSRPSRRDPTG